MFSTTLLFIAKDIIQHFSKGQMLYAQKWPTDFSGIGIRRARLVSYQSALQLHEKEN